MWLFLAGAIATEVTATMALRASEGLRRRGWIPVIAVGYVAAFVLLSLGWPAGCRWAWPTASGPPPGSP